jgi:hypothetical protein
VKKLRARLQRERDQLTASVPARSHHRVRYRVAIVAAAENILSMVIEGITDKDDWTAALESEYPEWFAGPDVTGDVKALRFQSARKDARELLDALAGRENVPRQVSHSGLAGSPRAPLYLVDPPDGRFRTADDAVLGALFRKAEQALLPHEMPYNLEQGLQMFIGWLDSQAGLVRSRPRPAVTNTP